MLDILAPFLGFSFFIAIALCVHVVRTNQPMYWLMIILMLQPLGEIVYFVAIVLPSLMGGRTAQKIGSVARETLDPHREYREAKAAHEDAPTVRNQSRLAAAAAQMGRHEEAERLYGEAAQGVYATDPVLLLGRANALLELKRADEALALLDRLAQETDHVRTAGEALAKARALEALGRNTEAEEGFVWAAERLPGFEATARYAAFQARTGRRAEATEALADIDRRLAKTNPQFRKEGRVWRDLAAAAISKA
jgi:hypothetical protein